MARRSILITCAIESLYRSPYIAREILLLLLLFFRFWADDNGGKFSRARTPLFAQIENSRANSFSRCLDERFQMTLYNRPISYENTDTMLLYLYYK